MAIQRIFLREVKWLQNLLLLKWTQGMDLDDQDLRDMVHMANTRYWLPHSGYDKDLNSGSNTQDLSIEASHPGSCGNVNDIGSNVLSVGNLHEDEIPTHFHHLLLKHAVDPNCLLKILHVRLANKPIIITWNPVPQPQLTKSSGQIAFPPPLVLVGATGAVRESGAAAIEDLDADNSEDDKGVIGSNLLATLLMGRVVYMAGVFILTFIHGLHPNPFQSPVKKLLGQGINDILKCSLDIPISSLVDMSVDIAVVISLDTLVVISVVISFDIPIHSSVNMSLNI